MKFGIIKFLASVFLANLVRLARFIPNNDPIMAFMLPVSKNEKAYKAFLFPFVTMVSFDIITGYIGVWTLVTALTYAGLGLFFSRYMKKRIENKKNIGLKNYLGCGVLGVLIFDFVTGVLATPFMFGMSFEQAFVGQIPFTLLHLASVSAFIVVLVPILDRHVLENSHLDDVKVLAFFKSLFVARA
ncbi:MAG: DUF6580 family putative transport protein [archaeon]